jgi:hypothetical protein
VAAVAVVVVVAVALLVPTQSVRDVGPNRSGRPAMSWVCLTVWLLLQMMSLLRVMMMMGHYFGATAAHLSH